MSAIVVELHVKRSTHTGQKVSNLELHVHFHFQTTFITASLMQDSMLVFVAYVSRVSFLSLFGIHAVTYDVIVRSCQGSIVLGCLHVPTSVIVSAHSRGSLNYSNYESR